APTRRPSRSACLVTSWQLPKELRTEDFVRSAHRRYLDRFYSFLARLSVMRRTIEPGGDSNDLARSAPGSWSKQIVRMSPSNLKIPRLGGRLAPPPAVRSMSAAGLLESVL